MLNSFISKTAFQHTFPIPGLNGLSRLVSAFERMLTLKQLLVVLLLRATRVATCRTYATHAMRPTNTVPQAAGVVIDMSTERHIPGRVYFM